MNKFSQAAILVNDLDSMVHRIEALDAHPRLTDALNAVHAAKKAVAEARADIHQSEMRARFAAMDAA